MESPEERNRRVAHNAEGLRTGALHHPEDDPSLHKRHEEERHRNKKAALKAHRSKIASASRRKNR